MPRIRLDGDAQGAIKANLDMAKAIKEAAKQADLAEKQLTKMEKQARRVQESVNPQQRYNRQIQETARLAAQGALSIEDAHKAAERYARTLDRAGRTGRNAFGGLVSQIGSMAAGVVSLTGLVAILRKTFAEAEQAANASAQATFASLAAQGELQQLTDDPAKLGKINQFGKQLVERGVFSPEQRGDAFRTSFLLESAGFNDSEKEFLARVGQDRFVAPDALVEFGGTLRKAQRIFGQDDTGNLETTLDKVIRGAAATQSDAGVIAGRIPEFASEAKAVGIPFEQALAGFVRVEQQSANPELAATRFKGFLDRLDKSGLAVNGDLGQTLDAIQAKVDAGTSLGELFPDVRGKAAARNLLAARGRGELASLTADIDASGGAFRRQSGKLQELDPGFAAGLAKASAEGSLAAAQTDASATREQLVDAVLAVRRARRLRRGQEFQAAFSGSLEGFQDFIGADTGLIRDEASRIGQLSSPTEAEKQLLPQLIRYLSRTAAATEKIAEGVERKPVTGRAE